MLILSLFNDIEYLETIVFLDQKLPLPLAVALWVRAAKTSRFIYEHLSLVKCKTAENPKPKFWRSSFLRWQRSMSFQGQVAVPVGGWLCGPLPGALRFLTFYSHRHTPTPSTGTTPTGATSTTTMRPQSTGTTKEHLHRQKEQHQHQHRQD